MLARDPIANTLKSWDSFQGCGLSQAGILLLTPLPPGEVATGTDAKRWSRAGEGERRKSTTILPPRQRRCSVGRERVRVQGVTG